MMESMGYILMPTPLVSILKNLIHKDDNNVKHVIVVFFIYNIADICFFPSCNDVHYMPQSSTLFNNFIFWKSIYN
jgi:hypothetical protein